MFLIKSMSHGEWDPPATPHPTKNSDHTQSYRWLTVRARMQVIACRSNCDRIFHADYVDPQFSDAKLSYWECPERFMPSHAASFVGSIEDCMVSMAMSYLILSMTLMRKWSEEEICTSSNWKSRTRFCYWTDQPSETFLLALTRALSHCVRPL